MLPQEPLKLSTDYICISCNFILNKDLVEDYQKSATALLATLKNGQLDKVSATIWFILSETIYIINLFNYLIITGDKVFTKKQRIKLAASM